MSWFAKWVCLFLCIGNAFASSHQNTARTLRWLSAKQDFFYGKILDNISIPTGKRGTVVAARAASNGPDYQYHWVRDAALAMMSLMDYYQETTNVKRKNELRQLFTDYLHFSTYIQNVADTTSLGEPKFYLDGHAYDKPWGRPQNDGPALRAISLIHFANILLDENEKHFVLEELYNEQLPATSPIKKDLEYISHHWKDPSFDLWEETKGTHFYTLMVIRRALLEGAVLAITLEDDKAANWYRSQARQIELALEHFWQPEKGYLIATINRTGGIDYKSSNLDTAVILGLLHGDMHDGFLAWDNPKVLLTLNKLTSTFKALYPINQQSIRGVAIGRYPEDRYDGDTFNGGNPWPLCTLAVSQAWFEYANILKQRHLPSRDTTKLATDLIARVKFHAYDDGSLDEQINRYTGYMTSAHDLTWNYAALLAVKHTAMT